MGSAGGSVSGGEPFAPRQFATVPDMAASAGATASDPALVTFTGQLAAVTIGTRLRLVTSGGDAIVTIQSIAYDPVLIETTWEVTPSDTDFAAQSVTVEEAPEGASAAGAAGGDAGSGTAGRIRIDKPGLFGGTKREGGIAGDIDVMMGGPAQQPNDYLAAQAGRAVPAYRGVTSLVLRQCYLGNNPYLKPWSVLLTRILQAARGNAQWYPEKAQIVPEAAISDAAIYIALDASGSMSGARMAAAIDAVRQLITEIAANDVPDRPNDLRLLTWTIASKTRSTRRNADATDYSDIQSWLDGLPTGVSGGTYFDAGVADAPAFFQGAGDKRRVLIFVTDGDPSTTASLEAAKGDAGRRRRGRCLRLQHRAVRHQRHRAAG